MQVTLEVVSALFAGLAIGGGFIKWLETRAAAHRATIPNVRVKWGGGKLGHSASVTIANRMDEDITIYRVEAKSTMLRQVIGDYDARAGTVSRTYEPTSRRESLDWRINAGETDNQMFFIEGAGSMRWLRFTYSSGAGTVRRGRLVIGLQPVSRRAI